MSSFLSPPHPHNLSPVRIWGLRGRTLAAHAGGDGAGPAAPSTLARQRGRLGVGQRREGGSVPWERGSAAQGSCPESLRVLSNSRGKRSAQGSVTHLGRWTAESGQNTFSGVKFSKTPSAEAFHQLLQTACAAPGLLKAPQVARPEGSAGRGGRTEPSLASPRLASPHSSTLPCSSTLPSMLVPAPVGGRTRGGGGGGVLSPPAPGHCQASPCSPSRLLPVFVAAVVCVTPLQGAGRGINWLRGLYCSQI